VAKLVAHLQHGHSVRQQQRALEVAHLALAQPASSSSSEVCMSAAGSLANSRGCRTIM
jgi:hypothetical protein